MTEAVKQWIAEKALLIATSQGFSGSNVINEKAQFGAVQGLLKGIEIAEGFAEWIRDEGYTQSLRNLDKWYKQPAKERTDYFTTSQLLEKYLEHLSSINKEKP